MSKASENHPLEIFVTLRQIERWSLHLFQTHVGGVVMVHGTWYMVHGAIDNVCLVLGMLGYKGLVVENCGDQADNMSQNREHDGTMTPD